MIISRVRLITMKTKKAPPINTGPVISSMGNVIRFDKNNAEAKIAGEK